MPRPRPLTSWLLAILASILLQSKKDALCNRLSDSELNGAYSGELIYLQILASNGFHAPLELYPGDLNRESAWPDGMAKLTRLGMLQLFQLGKALSKRYGSLVTSDPREVEVFSSEEDRSIQSTLCLMASLYAPSREWRFAPHLRWQPIPVMFGNGRYDKYVGYNPFCPRLISEQRKIVQSDPAQTMLLADEFLYSYWSNQTGLPMEDWNDVTRLFDILHREDANGLEVPHWAKMYWKDLLRITDSAYKWNFNSHFGLKLKIGSLIEVMVDRMRAKTLEDDPNPQTKVNVYMTHDWNIAAFLGSMFRYGGFRPPPAASIVLELYRYFDTHTVRFLFFNSTTPELAGAHDRPTLLLLRGCNEFCPLAYVINYFKDFVCKDWMKLCGIKHTPKEPERDESGRPFPLS